MKSRLFFYILIFFCTSISISAQQLSVQWATRMGEKGWDFANSIVQTSSGNFIIGGSLKGVLPNDTTHASLLYNNNAYLTSCDSNGIVLWQKTYGGGLFDNITSMSIAPQGILVSGIFQDTLTFDADKIFTPAFSGGYTALIDELGNPIWLRQIGGTATINNILNSTSLNGTSFIAGVFADSLNINETALSTSFEKGIFITRLQNIGNDENSIVLKGTGICNLGGLSCNDSIFCVAGSFSDSLQIADTTLVSMGEEDVFISVFDHAGKLLKVKIAGGIGTEQVRSLLVTNKGEIALTGFFDFAFLIDDLLIPTNGENDIFVTAIDTTFQVKWLKNIGGRGNDFGYSINCNNEGEYFVSGNFVHYMQLPDEIGNMIEIDASSAFGNAFIAKFNERGDIIASYNLPASSEDFCTSMVIGENGMITTVGNFYNQMKLTELGDVNADSLVSAGERDIFILRFMDLCHDISVNSGPDTTFCVGQPIFLTAPTSYQYYRWLPSGLPNQDLEVELPGTYKLIMTDMNGCFAVDSIVIAEKQIAEVYAGIDTTLYAGDILYLQDGTANYYDQLFWSSNGTGYFDNINLLNTTYTPSYVDLSKGNILLTLSATNQCGTVTDSRFISINQDDDGITAFPNPTEGIITLVCTEGISIQTATIVTQAGNVIQAGISVNNTVMQYDLSAYPPGTFLFHLTTSNNIVTKIINKL